MAPRFEPVSGRAGLTEAQCKRLDELDLVLAKLYLVAEAPAIAQTEPRGVLDNPPQEILERRALGANA